MSSSATPPDPATYDGSTLKVYAIEEIVAEKLLALSDRARNEPRDLYDLWYLLTSTDLLIALLRTELDAKLAMAAKIAAQFAQPGLDAVFSRIRST